MYNPDLVNEFMVSGGREDGGEEIVRGFGMDMHILLCVLAHHMEICYT